jgi:ribonuclease III
MGSVISQILRQIELIINYNFTDKKQLLLSLTHRSYLSEKDKIEEVNEHNERLEFLGDAVLELVTTEYLYKRFGENTEGFLTSLRASLVNYKTIGEIGNELHLDEFVLISNGERAELGKARITIVADALEALIGAIYLDGGYEPASNFINTFIISKLDNIINLESYKDSKTQLQEYTQKYFKQTPKYQLISSEGKDHDKVFNVAVILRGNAISQGSGKSKQEAETNAATKAMDKLEQIQQEIKLGN